MRRALFLLAFLTLLDIGYPATIHVPGNYPTIQEAIDAAAKGDTVLVAPGTYAENINFKGKAVLLKSEQGPGMTIIDGQQAGCVVTFDKGEGPDSVLDGFSITNGYASSGAGIHFVSSSPLVRNSVFFGNQAKLSGGGIFGYNSSALVENNTFTDNSVGQYGGGIAFRVCDSPTVRNNVVFKNTAICGGGVYIWSNSAIVENNAIFGNTAGAGGGFYANIYDATVTSNTIFGNTATSLGGGMSVVNASDITAVNTVFWDNNAPQGTEIAVGTKLPSTLTVSHCDVEGGMASVWVETGCTLNWGQGMIDADPLFVDSVDGDFHIRYTSPCRDAGDNSVTVLPSEDFEGDPRIAYGVVDMGADEFHPHLYQTGNAAPGGSIEVKLTGIPGSAPVGLWLGGGLLDPPLPCQWGDWYLSFPFSGPIDLGSIPSPDGVMVVPGTIPASSPAPCDICIQGLIGNLLTNYYVIAVR